MTIHELKTDPEPFSELLASRKLFEMRKADRNYQVGDTLLLRETQYSAVSMTAGKTLGYSGRTAHRNVVGMLVGPAYGLMAGWVIMSIAEELDPLN
jgi:hypothetical protein